MSVSRSRLYREPEPSLATYLSELAGYVARPMSEEEIAALRTRVQQDIAVLKVFARLLSTLRVLQSERERRS